MAKETKKQLEKPKIQIKSETKSSCGCGCLPPIMSIKAK